MSTKSIQTYDSVNNKQRQRIDLLMQSNQALLKTTYNYADNLKVCEQERNKNKSKFQIAGGILSAVVILETILLIAR